MVNAIILDAEDKTQRRSGIPEEYQKIRKVFDKAMEEDTPVLLENTEMSFSYSVVLKLNYVGDYFAVGKVRYNRVDGEEYVPYSIHYSDILMDSYNNSATKNTTITFKGENPFEDDDNG